MRRGITCYQNSESVGTGLRQTGPQEGQQRDIHMIVSAKPAHLHVRFKLAHLVYKRSGIQPHRDQSCMQVRGQRPCPPAVSGKWESQVGIGREKDSLIVHSSEGRSIDTSHQIGRRKGWKLGIYHVQTDTRSQRSTIIPFRWYGYLGDVMSHNLKNGI